MSGEALPMIELYDLGEAPWELNNLAEDRDHQDELKRLLGQLQRWSVRTDDRYTVLKSLSADTDTLLRQLTALK